MIFWVNFWFVFFGANGRNAINPGFIGTFRHQTDETEPTTLRLTGDRGKIPLFPLPPNNPILLGFLDSVEIMEIEIFHYSHTLQKNEEQNPVREP